MRTARRLDEAADRVDRAATAYGTACPDRPLAVGSPRRSQRTVTATRDLTIEVGRVAQAFRDADADRHGPRARAADGTLSLAIAARSPSFGSPSGSSSTAALTGPTRAATARGRATAHAMVRAAERAGAAGAVRRLVAAGDDARDPVFLASVFNQLGADRLQAYAEELAGSEHRWYVGAGPLLTLAEAWAVATRTLDRPAPGARLDPTLLQALLAEPVGRNVLRALAGSSGVASGGAYGRQVLADLAFGPVLVDDDLSAARRLLLGPDREGDPRAPVLRAIGLTPGAGVALLGDRRLGSTPAQRLGRLLDLGPGAQVGTAAIVRQWLDDPTVQSTATTPRVRSDVLRVLYDWVARTPVARITEPLAQLLADTLATDLDLFVARVDTVRGGTPVRVLTAITRFERPWLTALLALEAHSLARVSATLHDPPDVRLTALDDLHVLTDALEAAAARSDRPGPSSPLFFLLLRQVAGPLAGGLTAGAPPVVGTVVRAGLNRAIDEWKAATAPEPGTRAQETRLHREALRRRVWVAVAQDPQLAADLVWTVGGPGPGASGVLGSRIRTVDDLLALDGGGADLDELAGWAAAQPDHLRALVAGYLDGA
jgi:hypothetical protein